MGRPDINHTQLLKVPQPPADIPYANGNDNINQLKSNTMAVTVKEIKMEEVQEAIDHYWELFRKDIPLPNDPSVMGYTKSVFEAGFWAGTTNIFGTMTEAIQQLKHSSEHPSNVIPINVNHDPSKAN